MLIKQKLKKIKFSLLTLRLYFHDYFRYLKATDFGKLDSQDSLIFKLRKDYHKIEKGLTMTPRRKFFGERVLDNILLHISKINDPDNPEVIKAVQVIKKYLSEHDFDDRLKKYIDFANNYEQTFTDEKVGFYKQFKENYLYNESDIESFSKIISERRTTRHFEKSCVSDEDFNKVFDVARFSPSACNRQSWDVKVVKHPEKIRQILSLQNGNAGFGDDVKNLIVISGDLSSCVSPEERKQIWFDSGLFTMNLINVLHANNIGSCCLNWCVDNKKDLKINSLLDLNENKVVTVLLAVGYYQNEFYVCDSPKKNSSEFVEFVS